MPRPLTTCALALGLALAGGCQGGHRPVGRVAGGITPAAAIDRVAIDNPCGAVEVVEAADGRVSVEAEVRIADHREDSEFVPDFARHVDLVQSGALVTVRNRHIGDPDADDWHLRLLVRVPAGIGVRVDQRVGQVRVAMTRVRDLEIEVVTGGIDAAVDAVDGSLVARTITGQITAQVRAQAPAQGASVECTTGSATLALPREATGTFDLAVTTGALEVDPRYGLQVVRDTTAASASGQVGDGGPEHRVRVVTGQVRLR